MRIAGLVFSSIVTFSVAAMVLTYVPGYVGQDRIYVQGHHGNVQPDSARRATVHNSDSTLQRYYSESEGWTYYTLPAYSVAGGKR
jgi:hypothetical protein